MKTAVMAISLMMTLAACSNERHMPRSFVNNPDGSRTITVGPEVEEIEIEEDEIEFDD
jgi:hypothetical protein